MQNFKPGGLARFGLDYESVAARNPGIIYASISGFGSGGGKDLPGYDLMVQAMSGLMSLTGDPDGPPYRAGISVFDVIAGLHTAIAILAALHHRAATGEGQHVEASLMASALSGMVNQTSAYAAGGVVPFRMGNSHPSLFPYEPLPTADGDLIVTAGNDAQFRKLCEVLGAPRPGRRPAVRAQRRAAPPTVTELRPLLAERLAARPAADWFDALIGVGVPCGPINTVDAGVAFARGIGLEPVVDRGRGGRAQCRPIRHPITFSATPPSYPLPPPRSTSTASRSGPGSPRRQPRLRVQPPARIDRNDHMTQHDAVPGFPTSLGTSDPDTITLLGQDLAADLMGKVGFGELAFWLVTQRRPDPVAGPGVRGGAGCARRPRIHPDRDRRPAHLPERARLGAGGARRRPARRRLPVPRRDRGRRAVPVAGPRGGHGAGDPLPDRRCRLGRAGAGRRARRHAPSGTFVPGLGHPVHKVTDPRTPVLIRIAEEEGLRGPHLRLFEAIGRVHPQVLGRTLPLNGAGTCGAALADLGLPPDLLRGFALLARTAGLLGHLAEEKRRPVGMDVYLTVERGTDYLPPDSAADT